MKQSLILFTLLVTTFFACKKDVNSTDNLNTGIVAESAVPSAVLATFNASFSSSTEREWRYNDDDSYTCQFNLDDNRREAKFDDNGHQSSSNIICTDAAVPAVVLNAFRNNFPDDVVYEWKLTNEGTWKAHFLRNGVKWEVTIDAAGNILKTEQD